VNERNPPSKGTFSTPEPENDRLLMINKLDENTCCSKLIANDLLHGQRAFEKASDDETWLDENGDAIFYNQQFQIWQLIPNSVGKDINSFGTGKRIIEIYNYIKLSIFFWIICKRKKLPRYAVVDNLEQQSLDNSQEFSKLPVINSIRG